MRRLRLHRQGSLVDAKEGGLSYEIEQGGRNLSGGQRQSLTIARALVKKPEILIMDDSASALDFATDAALRKAIAHMDGQMTVFIVSQRAASIMQADKIVVLDDGEIVGLGTHEDLLKDCEVYREIYESQFKRTEEQQAERRKDEKVVNENQKSTLRKVLRYIRRYRGYLGASIILAAVTVALTLYLPILIGQAVDRIVGKGAVDFAGIFVILRKMAVIIGLTALAQWVMNACK